MNKEGSRENAHFPAGGSGKEPVFQCRRCKRPRFDFWVGENALKKGMATDSSILAWRIPWTEEPGGLTVYRVAQSQTRLKQHSIYSQRECEKGTEKAREYRQLL